MSEAKFTKGPWVITFRRDGYAYICMGGLEPGQQHKQFNLLLCEGEGNDEDDAHLISAAPDLYAALDAARIILAEHEPHPLPVLAQALTALAKARGEA